MILHNRKLSNVKANVLLAEDNEINIKLASRMLNKLNCNVDVVYNGKEAVESIRRKQYDIVLMDLQMPEMDGIAATEWLFSNIKEFVSIPPIIALTANTSVDDQETCLNAGMVDFIPKPMNLELLEKVLQRWIKSV